MLINERADVVLDQLIRESNFTQSSLVIVFADDELHQHQAFADLFDFYVDDIIDEINRTAKLRSLEIPHIAGSYFNSFATIADAYDFITRIPEYVNVVVLSDQRFTENQSAGHLNGHNLVYHLLGYEWDGATAVASPKFESQVGKLVSVAITSAFMEDYFTDILNIVSPRIARSQIAFNFIDKEDFWDENREEELVRSLVLAPLIDHASQRTIDIQHKRYAAQREMLLDVFMDAMYLKDRETTPFHVERVARCAVKLAEMKGLSLEDQDTIRWAAYLHDIGKLAVHDNILCSTQKFRASNTAQDVANKLMMFEHAMYSQYLLESLQSKVALKLDDPYFTQWLSEVVEIAISHHEKRNGAGYPRGLKGDQITEEMEILIYADFYDALRSPRSYKPALTHKEAVDVIKRAVEEELYRPELYSHVNTMEFSQAYEQIAADAEELRKSYDKRLGEARRAFESTPLFEREREYYQKLTGDENEPG